MVVLLHKSLFFSHLVSVVRLNLVVLIPGHHIPTFGMFCSSCWLSVETGVIWAFVGPAMVIIVVSIAFMLP